MLINHFIQNENYPDYQLSNYDTPDLVMALSCPAGIWSIKQCMNKATVVGIASLKGVYSYSYCDDGNTRIIKDAQISYF